MGLPEKEILMDYIIRSCDLLENGVAQKGKFDG
jgi:hypothetical protein